MTFEEFNNNLNDARSAKQAAINKLNEALAELAAAEAQMDAVLAYIPEGSSESAFDAARDLGTAFGDIFNPVNKIADLFGFGDLF